MCSQEIVTMFLIVILKLDKSDLTENCSTGSATLISTTPLLSGLPQKKKKQNKKHPTLPEHFKKGDGGGGGGEQRNQESNETIKIQY